MSEDAVAVPAAAISRPRAILLRAAMMMMMMVGGASPVARGAEDTGVLRVTVLDETHRAMIPCTVALVDAAGVLVTNMAGFAGGFRSSGKFERRIAAGTVRLRVTRGFEYGAHERTVGIPAGSTNEITIELRRVVDLRARGWFAGDNHVHMLHGERTVPVDFDDVALAARAEDLQYLSLAQDWTLAEATADKLEAELKRRSLPDCQLFWNLEAPKNYYRGDAGRCLGHCWNVGMRNRTAAGEDVVGLLMQASAHDYESEKPVFANFESHRLIRNQGGASFYSHPMRSWIGDWGGRGIYPRRTNAFVSNLAVELPLDLVAGPTFDGVDLFTTGGELEANAKGFQLWAMLLNHGYHLTGSASSDACFDRVGGAVPGIVRTYAQVGSDFSLSGATRALVGGRTFVTTGPLILASIDGQPPGTVFRTTDSKAADVKTPRVRQLHIEAWASGADRGGLTRIEVFRNGELMGQPHELNQPRSTTLDIAIDDHEAWYCVKAFGSDPRRERAITGAFYFESDVRAAGNPPPTPARMEVRVEDARTGAPLDARVTEVAYSGPVPADGDTHEVRTGAARLTVPATVRLRANASGYQPVVLSPFVDNPALLDYVTGLRAEDLLRWETFERIKALLGGVKLTFRLEPVVR